jgi:nitronate monooxygenase
VKGARGREGLISGDTQHGVVTAGMVMGLIHDIPTCHDLVARIVADAEAIIRGRLAGFVTAPA